MKPSIRGLLPKWMFGAMIALLTGCQSVPSHWRNDVGGSIDTSLEQAKTRSDKASVPSDVSKALLPPLEVALPEGKVAPLESRFDLAVAAAPARQVFMGLVEGTPYDIVVHPGVGGNVTLNLKDVTVPEALKALRETYGYEYRREGNRFFILGREIQMRLFNVNYLNLVRKGKSDTRVTATGLSSTGGSSGSTTTSQSGVQVATESQSDFWKDLQATLTALVGTDGGRKVIVNSQTGIVAVRAMPNELRLVEDYLGATHATVNRQVVLEAKILEVNLNDAFQTGINWAKIHGRYTFGQVGGGTSLSGDGTPGSSETVSGAVNLNPATGLFNTGVGTVSSAFGGIFSLAVKTDNFAAFLELLKSQGEVQVLSSPRVSTVNNQKAVIKVGTDEFFVIKQELTQGSTVGGLPTVTTELAPFFSGIALDVTPQIDDSGGINLHIHPSVSDVTGKTITIAITGTSSSQQLPTARSSVQESDNIVRVSSGQIIVIGGLMKEGSTDENASVPFLGDIPILGYLFKHKKITRVKKELVILLKPTVIRVDQDWSDAIGESQERIKKIRIGS